MHLKFPIYVLASGVLIAMKKLHSTVFTSLGWALRRRKGTGAPGMPPSAQRSCVSVTFVQERNIGGWYMQMDTQNYIQFDGWVDGWTDGRTYGWISKREGLLTESWLCSHNHYLHLVWMKCQHSVIIALKMTAFINPIHRIAYYMHNLL
jgi:hypothetical protein